MRLAAIGGFLIGFLLVGSAAHALRGYSDVYFLGASEFDAGNWLLDEDLMLFSNYAGVVPSAERGYWRGRWQSGRSSSDYLSELLGHGITAPSLDGGNNYAYGVGWLGPLPGEPAPAPNTLASFQMLWLSDQFTKLLAAKSNELDPNALYVVSVGGNDVSGLFGPRTGEAVQRAAMLVGEVQRLAEHGATEFAVVLLGTLGVADPARKAYLETYNAELRKGLAAIGGVNVTFISRDGFFAYSVFVHGSFANFLTSIGLNPALTSTCLQSPTCSSAAIAAVTADQEYRGSAHVSFDGVHADTKQAEKFAEFIRLVVRLQNPPKRFVATLAALPDVNANGTAEMVAFRNLPIVAEIRDGADGALLGNLTYLNSDYVPVGAAVLPDTDGDGIPEIAVLAARGSDGRAIVQIRDADGSGTPRQIFFATDHTPVALAVIEDDADNDGAPELAVLSHRLSDGRVLVEVKNAIGAANTQTIWGPVGYFARDLVIVPDANDDGVPEVAVLMSRLSDNRTLVQVRNATTVSTPQSVFFALGQTPIDLAVVPDKNGDGIPEVALLSSRISDGRPMVELRNAFGPAPDVKQLWLAAGHRGIALSAAAPTGGDAVSEIAALTQRIADGRVLLTVREADGSDAPRLLWYTLGSTAKNLAMFPDLDASGVEEGAVLLTRDSDGRTYVQRRNTLGAPAPVTHWFSPP
jgi:hypothetical protein